MACLKHFPGLGKGQEDTHKGSRSKKENNIKQIIESKVVCKKVFGKSYPTSFFSFLRKYVKLVKNRQEKGVKYRKKQVLYGKK